MSIYTAIYVAINCIHLYADVFPSKLAFFYPSFNIPSCLPVRKALLAGLYRLAFGWSRLCLTQVCIS